MDITTSTASNLFTQSFQYFGAGVATSLISIKTFLSPIIGTGMDWCPEFPKPVYSFASNVCHAREILPITSDILGQYIIIVPVVEELIFRLGIQELLLKQLPMKIAPSYVDVVNSKGAKLTRIALTALAFSLAHAMPPTLGWPNCSAARHINTFAFGVFLGGIQEVTGSPLKAMLFHAGMNAAPGFFMDNMGIQLLCPEVT